MAKAYHVTDCNFCLTIATNKKTMEYPNLPPIMRSVPHNDNLPVKQPEEWGSDKTDEDTAKHQSGTNS